MPPVPAPHAAPAAGQARPVELADIFRAHGAAYRETHRLARAPRRAMRAIETCRTAALGGHRGGYTPGGSGRSRGETVPSTRPWLRWK